MIVQGLGPGFLMVATRRSVILSFDGLEFVLTFLISGSGSAFNLLPSIAPPTIAADVLKSPLRPIFPDV
jgi:hypothetical protein